VISPTTYRLVTGLFECQDLGPQMLKGLSTPLAVHQVIGESKAQSRFEAAVQKGLTPLVGRAEELALLQRRWEQAQAGAGQVVLLSGEPGIGKSRLVEALKASVAQEGASCLELRCSPYHQNSALYPVIEYLQRVLRFQSGDTPEQKLQKVVQALGRMEQSDAHVIASVAKQSLSEKEIASSPPSPRNDISRLHDAVPLLAALLSLPHPEGYPAITLSPQKQKEKTHEALVAWLCAEAQQHAEIYAWEDLQWADPSTLELLTLFLNQVPTTRLLVMLTFRPEFIPSWDSHSYLNQLTLSRLGRSHVETMVEKVTGEQTLPKEVVQQIVCKTDGVPLFVEELTKSVLESVNATGRLSPQALDIPTTLQDALMARLDRLGPAKEIAQLGATIGREFSCELLQAVSLFDEERLQQGLKQLVKAQLIYQNGILPQAPYLFKHALIQDTAYQSLLKSTRQHYHQQIAQVLEEQFPEMTGHQPELLAHHYTEARFSEQAVPYWQKAGEQAIQRSTWAEASSHFTRGLESLKTLTDTPARVQQELTLQLSLNLSLAATRGYTAPEVKKTMVRIQELSEQLDETPQLFPVLFRLWQFDQLRGEFRTARKPAEQLMRLAQSVQDRHLLSWAHEAVGWTLYFLGELPSARPLLEQAITLYDPEQHPDLTISPGNPRVDCLSYVSWAWWLLGYPDQALKRSQEALALAREQSRPLMLALASGCAAVLHLLRREGQLARELAEETIALSTEQGAPYWLAVGRLTRGGSLSLQRQEEGIPQLCQGLAALRAMGAEMGLTLLLALLAEAYMVRGQIDDGLRVLTEALDVGNKREERFYEAELYRRKGELMLTQKSRRVGSAHQSVSNAEAVTVGDAHPSEESEAEACFLKAIEIARKQQARSLELRASTSLARLWQQQGKQKKAHQMLSEIYDWFTEGFDTKDLQEAKALLKGLG